MAGREEGGDREEEEGGSDRGEEEEMSDGQQDREGGEGVRRAVAPSYIYLYLCVSVIVSVRGERIRWSRRRGRVIAAI